MPFQLLTYAALGECLNISPVAARALASGLHLRRSSAPDGRTLVLVDVSQLRGTAADAESMEPARADRRVGRFERDDREPRAPLNPSRRRQPDQRKVRSEAIASLYQRLDDLQRQLDQFDAEGEDQPDPGPDNPLLLELFKVSAQASAARQTAERARAEFAAYRSHRWWKRALA